MRIFLKYRPSHGNLGQGSYSLSFMYNQDRAWYTQNAGVNILDTMIPDDKYTENSKGKRFAIVEFDETKISEQDLCFDLDHSYASFGVKLLSRDEAITFVKENTTLPEVSPNCFEYISAGVAIDGTPTPSISFSL